MSLKIFSSYLVSAYEDSWAYVVKAENWLRPLFEVVLELWNFLEALSENLAFTSDMAVCWKVVKNGRNVQSVCTKCLQ